MKYNILDEHAWTEKESFCAEIKIENIRNEIFLVKGVIKKTSNNRNEEYDIYCIDSQEKDELLEKIDSFDKIGDSEYVDFILIAHRMLKEVSGDYVKTRYDILQKRTRMTDSYYGKLPESEIEIQFYDGEKLYLFAYQADSFVEYGISKISWLDQDETGVTVKRETDIIESYDSLQDCMVSDHAALFLELNDMMCNAEDFPDEYFPEYEEGEIPGYYNY